MIRLFTKRMLILEFQALTTHDDMTCHYKYYLFLFLCLPLLYLIPPLHTSALQGCLCIMHVLSLQLCFKIMYC